VSVSDLTPDAAFDPLTPFGTPQIVTELTTTANEDDPSLTADMLEIYFDRDGDLYRSHPAAKGLMDIFVATRGRSASPPAPGPAISSPPPSRHPASTPACGTPPPGSPTTCARCTSPAPGPTASSTSSSPRG